MAEWSVNDWTPSPVDLQWLCQGEADADTLMQCATDSRSQFRFWRVESTQHGQVACGVRLLAGNTARLWVATEDQTSAELISLGQLIAHVHHELAKLGVVSVQWICEEKTERAETGSDLMVSLGYCPHIRMVSMQHSPIVARDVGSPRPSKHQLCDRYLLDDESTLGWQELDQLYQATCIESAETTTTSWAEIVQSVDCPLCIRHLSPNEDVSSGLLLLETANPDVWQVRYLGVVPNARRQQQASCLLYQATTLAGRRSVSQMHVWVECLNRAAIACYELADFCRDSVWCCWGRSL